MSIEQVKQFQTVVERASSKLGQAQHEYDKQLRRFKDHLERTIECDPQLLKTDGWLMHHTINTLEWDSGRIASVIGVTHERFLADVY